MNREGVCFVGYGETPHVRPTGKDKSLIRYQAEAITAALDNAGLKKKDVRGLVINAYNDSQDVASIAETLGLELDWLLRMDCGGAAGVVSARRAADAIQLGEVDVVVSLGAAVLSPRAGYRFDSYQQHNFAIPFAMAGPPSLFALLLKRYIEDYGLTPQQLGKIAIAQRKNAASNEHALFRSPMTTEDYLNSRVVCDPMRLYDVVPPCSGGGAYVITSERKAKELMEHPIYLVSDCEKINYQVSIPSTRRTGTGFDGIRDELFSRIKRDEIDIFEIYDAFTIVVVMQLEGLGFFEKGEAGEFLDSHDLTFSGDFPLNTGGGELSCGQAGSAGPYLPIVEAIRQLKGEAGAHQVKGAQTALVSVPAIPTVDVPLGYAAAMILQRR